MLRQVLRKATSAASNTRFPHRRSFTFFSRVTRRPDEPGQFGLPGLHSASDWQRIAETCVSDCLLFSDRIRNHPTSHSPALLHLFDDLSDRLCSVLDVAELCRNVHPNPEFAQAADQAFSHVSSIMQHLNSDYALYRPLNDLHQQHLNAVRKGADRHVLLSEEDVVMAESLKSDFEAGGIQLGANEKEQLIAMQDRVNSLGMQFTSSDSHHVPTIDLPESKLRQLPASLRVHIKPSSKPQHMQIPVNGVMAQALLKWIPDSRVRQKVFEQMHNHDSEPKLRILESLLQTRKGISHLLGHSCYADLLFKGRVASSPDDVLHFLKKLSRFVQEMALTEKNRIGIEKMRAEPYSVAENNVSVHGWDRSYYIGRLKAQDYDLSSAAVARYLPLSACLSGLADITEHIFGVNMAAVQPEKGELWHDDVQKFEFVDQKGRLLGHIFLDLFPREGKYGHAAHFSIRCGRQPSTQPHYQTPIVALVCNFSQSTQNENRLLTISEYETLFHEFGHSLHSILSQTKYQHLSGTRVATDFVEIPSHLFEHFAWDPRILSRFARHHKTGDPMPTRMLKSLCSSRHGFVATDLQMQLLFSAMDLQFHGPSPPLGSLVKTFEALQSEFTVYPPDNGTCIPASFHHFVGYGAGYYSYVFARVISAQLWSALFEKNPLSREGGVKLWKELLAHGSAYHPAALIENTLDHDLSCAPFLRSTGIDTRNYHANIHLPLAKIA